mmetsp:Transcript_22142/g.39240  ORF Transcript_22142/g.39240 Transcript_22142/m.39240 type:complete len:211 (+) Transcript_22142:110-742(+)
MYYSYSVFFLFLAALSMRHRPIVWQQRITTRSRPISKAASSTLSFDPGISCQLTAISFIGMPSCSAINRTSTSKHHRLRLRLAKSTRADSRVNSLKPHCVSLMLFTARDHTRKWNPCIKIERYHFLLAVAFFSRWALDPTTIPCPVSGCLISLIASRSLSRSLMRVAPSASTIRRYSPRAWSMPCWTAPPLPWFWSSVITRKRSAPSFLE